MTSHEAQATIYRYKEKAILRKVKAGEECGY